MDALYLLQYTCLIFMMINAAFVALSALHTRWKNKKYERSRWMLVAGIMGLAVQYLLQMKMGLRLERRPGGRGKYAYLYALLHAHNDEHL